MDYTEVGIVCKDDAREILMAEMDLLGVESMMETEPGFKAYFLSPPEGLDEVQNRYKQSFPFTYTLSTIKKQNWNKVWESNFSPVEVGRCRVRATFHEPDPSFEIDLVIEPKMSFGTGHHETTSLMLEYCLEMDLEGKHVLDCGYGTGILSIISKKLGAELVEGTEVDPWCMENARENEKLNAIQGIGFKTGTIDVVDETARYHVILANINKNVLLAEIPAYASHMEAEAILVLSGFYAFDLAEISSKCEEVGLIRASSKSKNDWTAGSFVRKQNID